MKLRKVKGERLRMGYWSDPIFDISIVLMHGDWEPTLKWLNDTFKDVSEDECGEGRGAKTILMQRPQGQALAMWFPSSFATSSGDDLGVLAHECFHAATLVLGNRGLTVSDSSDEAFAYYIGWMFRECHKRLAR